jgi:3-methyladenine DNA glycosylase AlkD
MGPGTEAGPTSHHRSVTTHAQAHGPSDARAHADLIVADLRTRTDPAGLAGLARYGIEVTEAVGGVSMPELRAMGRKLRPDHDLALALWESGVYEARMLAAMVDDPARVTEAQMEAWAASFESWADVDGVTGILFSRTPFAWGKAVEWSGRDQEFVKRAAFAMMAWLAVHDREADDARFEALLPIIEREAGDPRKYVRKGVNWALRQIGKRDRALNAAAIASARRILAASPRGRNWVGSDALRELTTGGTEGILRRQEEQAARTRGGSARQEPS